MSGLENANLVVSTFENMARENQKGEIGFNEKTNDILVYKGQGWKGAHKIRSQAHVPGPYWTKMKPYVKWEKEYALQGQDSALRDLFTNAVRGVYGQQAYTMAADYLAYKPLTCYRVRRVFDRIEHNKAICQARFFAAQRENSPLPGTYQALLASLQPAEVDTSEEAKMFREFLRNANQPALRKLAEKTFARAFERSGEPLTYNQRVEKVRKSIVTFAEQRREIMKRVYYTLKNRNVNIWDKGLMQNRDILFINLLWDQSVVTGISNENARWEVMKFIKDKFIDFVTKTPPDNSINLQTRQEAMIMAIFSLPSLPTSFKVTGRYYSFRRDEAKCREIDVECIYDFFGAEEDGAAVPVPQSQDARATDETAFQNASVRLRSTFPEKNLSDTTSITPPIDPRNPNEWELMFDTSSWRKTQSTPQPSMTLPETATEKDRKFLKNLRQHSSWAQVPNEQVEEVMRLIIEWYFEQSDRPLNGGTIDDNVDPKKSFMNLYSTLKNQSDCIPLLHQSICASDLQQRLMPAGLSQTEKKIFLELTKPHFFLFSQDSIQDYGNYVTFVAQNIHLLPYCKLESSVVMRGERNYQNATIRIKAALQKPRNNSTQSALMRLRLAGKLLGDHRRVFLFLTSNNNVSMEEKLSFYVYRNYLIIIYQKIEDIVKVYQQNEGLDRTCLWEAVTGNSIPPDVTRSNFVSRLVAWNPEPVVEPKDQSRDISPLQKTIVSSTLRDPLLVQIVEELTAFWPKEFPGKDNIGRVTLTSFQTKLYTAVRPWVSDRTPNYINDFILALLQPYQKRLKDQTNGRVAFENLLAEIKAFNMVQQDRQGLQTLKAISEQGAAPVEVISFLRETVRSARNSKEKDKNTKLTEDVLAEKKLERFAVRSDGDCFYHAAAFLLGKDEAMTVRRDLETFFNEKPWRDRFSVPDPTFNGQKGINVDDPNSGNDSNREGFSSLDPKVLEMLGQFDFWQEDDNAGPSSLIAERMDLLTQMAKDSKIGHSADKSKEEIPGEWGTLDLIPLLVHIYQRPIGFIAPNVTDEDDKIQPIVCRIDLFTGKPLDGEEPLYLLFNGSDHWDATYRESELLKKNGEWTDVTLDKSTPSKQGNTSRLPVNQMTPNISLEKAQPKNIKPIETSQPKSLDPSPWVPRSILNKSNNKNNQVFFQQWYFFKTRISSYVMKEDGEFLINLMKDPSMEQVNLKERPKVMEQIGKWYIQQLAKLPKDTPISDPRHPQKLIEELREEFVKTQQPFIPSFFNSIKSDSNF